MQQIKRVPQWTIPTNGIPGEDFSYAGTHVVADFWFGRIIESKAELEKLLRDAAKAANSKALQVSIHAFAPQGITGVILLAESHITVHTWPEINYIAIDVFTCGKGSRPQEAIAFFRNYLRPRRYRTREIKRGRMPA